MDRRFHPQSYHGKWNNQVLPVVFYLTLPTVSCCQTLKKDIGKRTKTAKQKQRDMKRLNDYNESKSICSLFPFSSVDNKEIQDMIPRQHLYFTPRSIEKYSESQANKIIDFQEENKQLTVTISQLRESVTNEKLRNSDLKKENSVLNMEVSKVQKKLQDAEHVIANLQCVANTAKCNLRNAETEILNQKQEIIQKDNRQKETEILKDEMISKFNREIENNERIRKEFSIEVKGLKAEIRCLKTQVTSSDSIQVNSEQSATNVATIRGTCGTKGSKSNKKASKGSFHQCLPLTTSDNLPCHRCGSLHSTHQPSQCPAKNFLCGYCSKRGHHTLNCLQVCKGCGAKGRLYHKLEDCVAQDMNCAYCNVKGHLSHVCLQKRFDEEDPAYPPHRQDPAYPAPGQASYGYTPGQGPQTVVVTQPAYAGGIYFHESPVRLRCQFCQADIVTTTTYQTGALTWLACVILAFVGCWLGCCLIPFVVDASKDVVHKCPNCRRQLGIYKRL